MKKSIVLLSFACFMLLFGQIVSAAPLVYLDLDGNGATAETSLGITVGDPFTANIYASGIVDVMGGDHGGLVGFGVEVNYMAGSGIISSTSSAIEAPWFSLFHDDSPGSVKMQGGSFIVLDAVNPLLLGTINFASNNEGLVDLNLLDLNPGSVDFLAADLFEFDHLIDFQGAQITVAPVPLPGAVWLLGAGLTGLIGLRSRRRKTAL